MIFAIGWPPERLTAIWAWRIARVWIFTKSGIISPRRQPRSPSIGFCSCIERIAARSSLSSSVAPPASSARVTLTSCSSRFGRNSWSGGSIRRMTTGRPSIARKMPSKSPCWRPWSFPIAASNVSIASCSSGVRLATTATFSSTVSDSPAACRASAAARASRFAFARVARWATRIAPRTISSRSPSRNMCSVRQRPIPWAPYDRAWAASSGLSAFVQTPIRRIPSAQPRIVWSSGWSSKRASTVGSAPWYSAPVEPSRLTQSPSLNEVPVTAHVAPLPA